MKLFRNYVQMAIFISCVLLAHNGQAQTVDNDKLQVSLPVTPLDEKTGSGITLNKDQIKVFLGKTEQTITEIVSAETPAKVVFLVDYSGSMREPFKDLTKIRTAFIQFFQISNPANEYALLAFNSDVALIKDWTTQPQDFIAGLDSLTAQKPQGKTALYDSLVKGINYLNARTQRHPFLSKLRRIDCRS